MGEMDMPRYVFVTRLFAPLVNADLIDQDGLSVRPAPPRPVGLARRTPAFRADSSSIVNPVQSRKINNFFHTVPLSKNRAGGFLPNFNFYLRLRG